nr:RecX family [uncultured bacterium]
MPRITRITEQKRRASRRSVFIDGRFAFGCSLTVIARFRLREGMEISAPMLREIELGVVKQECFDKAMSYLQARLHSSLERRRKLARQEWGDAVIDAVIEDLTRLGYLDDARFAKTKALSAAEHRKHGRRRAFVELIKSGVNGDVAQKALDQVYESHDSTSVARELAMKQKARLSKLDPLVARRRLVGMLQRRGFDYDAIRPLIDEVLGLRDRD